MLFTYFLRTFASVFKKYNIFFQKLIRNNYVKKNESYFYADAGLGGYGRKCTGHHLGH